MFSITKEGLLFQDGAEKKIVLWTGERKEYSGKPSAAVQLEDAAVQNAIETLKRRKEGVK